VPHSFTHRESVESIRHRLTAKLDAKGVVSCIGNSIVNVDCAITVVFYVNVNDFAKSIDTYIIYRSIEERFKKSSSRFE